MTLLFVVGRLRFLFASFFNSSFYFNWSLDDGRWSSGKNWKFIEAYGFSCARRLSTGAPTNHYYYCYCCYGCSCRYTINRCIFVYFYFMCLTHWSSLDRREYFIFFFRALIDHWTLYVALSHLRKLLVYLFSMYATVVTVAGGHVRMWNEVIIYSLFFPVEFIRSVRMQFVWTLDWFVVIISIVN